LVARGAGDDVGVAEGAELGEGFVFCGMEAARSEAGGVEEFPEEVGGVRVAVKQGVLLGVHVGQQKKGQRAFTHAPSPQS
jgi:hypothetical protein